MPTFNLRNREICLKIVYVGPGLGGKTTNIERLHSLLPRTVTTDLRLLKTEDDRTLFFDFFAVDLPTVGGMRPRVSIYGVPGQAYYKATRRAALNGVDGLVFVADSQKARLDDNLEALRDIHELLAERGIDWRAFPTVFQWNKRDLTDLSPVEELEKYLNVTHFPSQEAVAIENKGVVSTFQSIVKGVSDHLSRVRERP